MVSNNTFNYANIVATSTHMPSPKGPFSRDYTNPEGYLDNPCAKKRFGDRPTCLKYSVSNYTTSMRQGSDKTRSMPWLDEFYDILEVADVDTSTIIRCHEYYSAREVWVEFNSEESKELYKEVWLDEALKDIQPKARILPRAIDDARQSIRRRIYGLPSCVSVGDIQKAVQQALPSGCDVLKCTELFHKPMTLTKSKKVIEKFPFGGMALDLLVEENSVLPEAIWLKIGTKYEGFELLREGRQKTAQPVVDLCKVPSHCLQEEREDERANSTAPSAMPSSTAAPATLPPAGELRISLSEVESDASSSSGRSKRRKKKKSKPSPPDCESKVLDNLTNLITETHSAASASSSTTPTNTWYDRSPLKTTKEKLLSLKSLLHKATTSKNVTELRNHDLYINSQLKELLEGTEFAKMSVEKEDGDLLTIRHRKEEVWIWAAGESAYKMDTFENFMKLRRDHYDQLCNYLEHLDTRDRVNELMNR